MNKPSLIDTFNEIKHKQGAFTTNEGFTIKVSVHDLKESYGVTLALIRPVNGLGQKWVHIDRIYFEKEGKNTQNGVNSSPPNIPGNVDSNTTNDRN